MASPRKSEWEAIAGLVAAVVAIFLHFLHVTEGNVLRVITLVLFPRLLLRDLCSEERSKSTENASMISVRLLEEVKKTTHPADIHLIDPTRLGRPRLGRLVRACGD